MYGGQKEYSSMTLELNASDSRGIEVGCGLYDDDSAVQCSKFRIRSILHMYYP